MKPLPQNIEAERALLGSLLLDNGAIDAVAGVICADDFFHDASRMVFAEIIKQHDSGKPVDTVTLSDALKRSGGLGKAGGVVALSGLTDGVPVGDHAFALNYARLVRRDAILRALTNKAYEIGQKAHAGDADPVEILSEIDAEFGAIRDQAETITRGAAPISEIVQPTIARLEKTNGKISGLTTGFPDIDQITAGWQPSEYVVIAARPSVGKTAFALECALRAARKDMPVGIFSLEMSREALTVRLLCREGQIDSHRLRLGYLKKDEWERLFESAAKLSDMPIWIDDARGLRSGNLRWRIRTLAKRTEAKLIFVDYLQLLSNKGTNRNEEMTLVSRDLQAAAGELGKISGGTLVVLSQLSRDAVKSGSQEPELHHLRDTGSIEQDADTIIFLYNEQNAANGQDHEMVKRVHVKKQRNGPCRYVRLVFAPKFVGFGDAAPPIEGEDE